MIYEEGLSLLESYVNTLNILNHSKEVAAIMEGLAEKLEKDTQRWKLAGLLHDMDYDIEKENMKNHTKTTVKILGDKGFDKEFLNAILSHNEEETGIKRETDMDFALAASDNMAGLVRATTLVYPDKKIASVKPNSVVKRFKAPTFAAGARRDKIAGCEKLGLSLEEFAEISVNAIKKIAEEIGL